MTLQQLSDQAIEAILDHKHPVTQAYRELIEYHRRAHIPGGLWGWREVWRRHAFRASHCEQCWATIREMKRAGGYDGS